MMGGGGSGSVTARSGTTDGDVKAADTEVLPEGVQEASRNDLSLDYFNPMYMGNMLRFAELTPPQGVMVRACITVHRGVFAEYTFNIESANGSVNNKLIPIMRTQRKKSSANVQYAINMLTDTGKYVRYGHLNSNFTRTK
jgi:hypothetical protein